ncbi:LacI family DNA-binding transcriptional regulator [Pontiella sp.]|uniref:LacI family DNA-binding transcriptional regulator n=1 Tax=Pontiella sp. TaxID=2837462 RepID=UPI00356B2D56
MTHSKYDLSPDEFPDERPVTYNDIARALGVSKMTVSLAMRNHPRISEATRQKVMNKAEELGYRPDPALAALHRYTHASRTPKIKATLGWLNTWKEPDGLFEHREFRLYFEGARDYANRMGYRLEEFRLNDISAERLETIFKTRNIQGLLLPPQRNPCEQIHRINWSELAVVRLGRSGVFPETHFAASAQMQNTIMAFERVQQLGYKRIGFAGTFSYKQYFTAGYLWAQNPLPENERIPPLNIGSTQEDPEQLTKLNHWLEQMRPDAIITDSAELLDILKQSGYQIPGDLGLATTSIHDTPIDAGIDQRPRTIGRAGARLLTAFIAERAFGLPEYCDETLIEGRWVNGTMMPPKTNTP